jgi:hypothetical protein
MPILKSQTARTISTAAVLGAGVIGSSWIEAILSQVRAWDPHPDITRRLAPLVQRYGDALEILGSPEEAVQDAGSMLASSVSPALLKRPWRLAGRRMERVCKSGWRRKAQRMSDPLEALA